MCDSEKLKKREQQYYSYVTYEASEAIMLHLYLFIINIIIHNLHILSTHVC